jgi:hypothetical protein
VGAAGSDAGIVIAYMRLVALIFTALA